MKLLSAPYFEMYENISKKTAIMTIKDLTKRIKNQIVLVEEFMFEYNNRTSKYDNFTHHTTIHDILLDRHFG